MKWTRADNLENCATPRSIRVRRTVSIVRRSQRRSASVADPFIVPLSREREREITALLRQRAKLLPPITVIKFIPWK